MNARACPWTALGGLLLGVLGVGWDRAWHGRQPGGGLAGAEEVLEAHWLMILGVLILFVALGTGSAVDLRAATGGRRHVDRVCRVAFHGRRVCLGQRTPRPGDRVARAPTR